MNKSEKKKLVEKLNREIEREEHPPMGMEGEMIWCDIHHRYFNVYYGCGDCRHPY